MFSLHVTTLSLWTMIYVLNMQIYIYNRFRTWITLYYVYCCFRYNAGYISNCTICATRRKSLRRPMRQRNMLKNIHFGNSFIFHGLLCFNTHGTILMKRNVAIDLGLWWWLHGKLYHCHELSEIFYTVIYICNSPPQTANSR